MISMLHTPLYCFRFNKQYPKIPTSIVEFSTVDEAYDALNANQIQSILFHNNFIV